jgi:D-glycero-alpha-D-manno-heptose-7-phosphate kinase
MIITRTPFRVSLLGGGTDYPVWVRKHGGVVLGGAINKYSYITARHLPPFHDYRHRVVYRETETVGALSDLRNRTIKESIEILGWPDSKGLEISHLGDLPGRSGTGSSSTFVVGLLHAISALQGKFLSQDELASLAIRVEQERLKETVGYQDQTFAAHGGLNLIRFLPDGTVHVNPLGLEPEHVRELESHLLLFFTRMTRTSSHVAKSYAGSLLDFSKEQFTLMKLAEDGVRSILARDWEQLGRAIDQSWRIKSSLSSQVSGMPIDHAYAAAQLAGAWGGKLTGAGGGGCMLLVAPPEKQQAIRSLLSGWVHIPFSFEQAGSRVVFAEKSNV